MSNPLERDYDDSFFDDEDREGSESAPAIVKVLVELTEAASVLDVGCGTGSFLAAFRERGVSDIRGVDGAHVDTGRLRIDPEAFAAHDISRAFDLGRRFDLVVSTEVAEHIPADDVDVYLNNLTRHADIVAFSAAIPDQGGVHHVNEQWPAYWIEKFQALGYECIDAVRHQIWDDESVAFYYRQNLILFVRSSALIERTALAESARIGFAGKAVVHPGMWVKRNKLEDVGLRRLVPAVGSGVGRSMSFHSKRLRGNK